MGAPRVRVEVRFTTTGAYFGRFWTIGVSAIGGADPIGGDSWVDLSSQVVNGKVDRGRQRTLDAVVPGRAQVVLDNRSGFFDPDNTASPYYGQIQPGRQVRVIAEVAGVDYPLFAGDVDEWSIDDSPGSPDVVTLIGYDALADLAVQELDEIAAAHSGDTSGARVARILDLPEVAFDPALRDIDTGHAVFGPTTFTEQAAAAGYLQLAAQSEGGDLWVTPTGVLRFKERNTAPGAVEVIFSNDGDVDAVLYESATRPFTKDLVYTRVKQAGTSGIEQVVEDVDAQAAYKVRTLNRPQLLTLDDDEVEGQARWWLARFSSPERRFRDIKINVATLAPARQVEVLGLDLTSRATCEKTIRSGFQVVQDALVDRLGFAWAGVEMNAEVGVTAGARLYGWVVGDPVLGRIGTARITY